MALFIAPHNDDETLFGAFTILRERPLVVVVFDGHAQKARGNSVGWVERRLETRRALEILGSVPCYLGFSDDDPKVTAGAIRARLLETLGAFNETVFAPALEVGGHAQHNLVAAAVDDDPRVVRYLTYTPAGKSTSSRPVPIERPEWIGKKLRALSCYESQWDPRLGCYPHFLRDQTEYYAV
jgi:LmbE family N-acetylglucosaminyl deacetylase